MLEQLQSSINSIDSSYRRVGRITSLDQLFAVLINTLLGITFAVSVVGITYSLFQFIMSRGEKSAVEKAKLALTWSVVALLVTLFVVAFKNILFKLIGIDPVYTNDPSTTETL